MTSPHRFLTPDAYTSIIAGPGTAVGDQKRDEFIETLLSIFGDTPMLWLPKSTDGTTSTTDDRNANTITWDATVASRFTSLGSGSVQDFNGTSDEGDIPDADRFSRGDGSSDQPMSIVALLNPDSVTAEQIIFGKYDATTGNLLREYVFYIDANGDAICAFYDESSNGTMIRRIEAPLTIDTWVSLIWTYDGLGSSLGINIIKNGVQSADVNSDSSYTAMENLATKPQIGTRLGATANESFFNGDLAMVALVAKALTVDEAWAIKAAQNAFFDLSL